LAQAFFEAEAVTNLSEFPLHCQYSINED